MMGLLQDARYALRQLRKSPGFTAIAVLSLAIGIGAGTAVFSVASTILLPRLPVPNPQNLRTLRWSGTDIRIKSWTGDSAVSPPAFERLREQAAGQADVFGYIPLTDVVAHGKGEQLSARGLMVSANFFSGLGVQTSMGRTLGLGSDYADAGTSVVIGHSFWEKHFGLDPAVIGKPLVLNGTPFTVVGVLPRGFAGVSPGDPSDFYVPMSSNSQFLYVPINSRFHWYVRMMARMKPGASDSQLQAALNVAFAREASEVMKSPGMSVEPGSGGPGDGRLTYRRPLMLMLAVVGVVILVACANLAGLLLARGAAQGHELSVKVALGAGRWRMIRQSLTESLVLALFGGGCGVLLAEWCRPVILRLLTGPYGELRYEISLDYRVLGFALVLALVSAILSGVLPAIRAGRVDPREGLATRGVAGASGLRTARVLVTAQVCLSLLLLTAAGLYARTLNNLAHVDPGFNTSGLLLFKVNLRGSGYADSHPAEFYGQLQSALNAIPGAQAASFLEYPLLDNANSSGSFNSFSHRDVAGPHAITTRRMTVGETFFATIGMPIVSGRGLSAADNDAAPKVVVVNEAFVRQYLPKENPLGLTIPMYDTDWQIVGGCRDTKYANLRQQVPPTSYFPFRQRFYSRFKLTHLRSPSFALRTSVPPLSLASAVRKAVADIDPGVPVTGITTQDEVRDRGISQERLFAALCVALALLATMLSCIGLYGLMAFNVTRRSGEIAVRMTLGATPARVLRAILREALVLAGAGLIIGVPVTLGLARLIRSQLFGVAPDDPVTLSAAGLLLLAVTSLAGWLPAHRAAKVDPMVALRHE